MLKDLGLAAGGERSLLLGRPGSSWVVLGRPGSYWVVLGRPGLLKGKFRSNF